MRIKNYFILIYSQLHVWKYKRTFFFSWSVIFDTVSDKFLSKKINKEKIREKL